MIRVKTHENSSVPFRRHQLEVPRGDRMSARRSARRTRARAVSEWEELGARCALAWGGALVDSGARRWWYHREMTFQF